MRSTRRAPSPRACANSARRSTSASSWAASLRGGGRRLASFQVSGALQHQHAEGRDAEVGRPQHLAGAVVDQALAVLDGGVLVRDALDAGEALALLQLAVDPVVVRPPAHWRVALIPLGVDRRAARVCRALA